MGPEQTNSSSGERNAVYLKSGEPVDPSGPGLKRPTLPLTADRISATHLIPRHGAERSGGDPLQPKSGRGLGQRPISAEGAVPLSLLDSADVTRLVEFFLLLDAWDRRREIDASSCRLCLTACNSRQFDEVGVSSD